MKHGRKLKSVLVVVGLLAAVLAWAEVAQAAEAATESEWDLLLEGKEDMQKPPSHRPGQRQARSAAPVVCPVDGAKCTAHEGKCGAEGCKLNKERRGPAAKQSQDGKGPRGEGRRAEGRRGRMAGRSGRGGPGRREMRQPQVDPDELIEFLGKYEPELAGKINTMRNEKPDDFRRRLPILGKLYGPLIEEMTYDPTITKLKVKCIRLRLRAKAGLDMIKDSKDTDRSEAGEKQIREAATELFEVIMEQQQLKYDRLKGRLDERAAAAEKKDTKKSDKGKGPWNKRLRDYRKNLTGHKQMLEAWRENKESIIDKHVENMSREIKPFPWGR